MNASYPSKDIADVHRLVWQLTRPHWEWGARMGHGPDHAERIYEAAMLMCKLEEVDPLAVGAASYLVDAGIGDAGGRDNHISVSLALADKVVTALPALHAVRGIVLECIQWHEAEFDPPPTASLSALIVRDADTLDRLGFTGIRMTLTYGLWVQRPLFNLNNPFCLGGQKPALDSFTFDYLRYLRCVVAGRPSTRTGQQIAREKILEMDAYFSDFEKLLHKGGTPTYADANTLLQTLKENR